MMRTQDVFDIRLAYEAVTDVSTALAKAPSKAREGREIRVPCPVHGDEHASMDLDIVKNRCICRACNFGGDAVALVMAAKNLKKTRAGFIEAFDFLRKLSPDSVHATKQITYGGSHHSGTKNVVNVTERLCFHYDDRYGELKYDVIRIEGKNADGEDDKDFLQRRKLPDGGKWYDTGDAWVYYDVNGRPVPWSLSDSAPVSVSKHYYNGRERRKPGGPYTFNMRGVDYELYHLPEVIAAAQRHERIFLVEGEKKCDALRARLHVPVTTFAGGANATLERRWCYDLAGARQLIVLADSDPIGVRAAQDRAQHFKLGVFDVRVIDLYGDNSKRDIDDWLAERRSDRSAAIAAQLEQHILRSTSV